jgi:hypothetical protein
VILVLKVNKVTKEIQVLKEKREFKGCRVKQV